MSNTASGPEPPKGQKRKADEMSNGGTKLVGTGAIVGAGAEDSDPTPIPRPMSSNHHHIRHYKKFHRLLSYGLASKIFLQADGTTKTHLFMIQSLAEVPWDRLFMYMNPCDFAILPPNSKVSKMSIKIYCESARNAFPMNASETNQATLNNNKFIRYAVGLNKKLGTINVVPATITPTKPIVVATITPITSYLDYNAYGTDFYGVANDDADFTTKLPVHQVGEAIPFKTYLALCTQKEHPFKAGWQDLQSEVTELPADAAVGRMILSQTYTPVNGLIKAPYQNIFTGYLGTGAKTAQSALIIVPGGAGQHQPTEMRYTTSYTTGNMTDNIQMYDNLTGWSSQPSSDQTNELASLSQYIEKAQWMGQDLSTMAESGAIPSIHVGVVPIKALTSSAIFAPATDSYVDVEQYFQIECEMEVTCTAPSDRPLATKAHLRPEEMGWFNKLALLQPGQSMINGMYCNKSSYV